MLTVKKHFDNIAEKYDYYTSKRELHYTTVKKLVKKYMPGHGKVFEVGCGTGDVIAYIKPKHGIGYDISTEMVKIARKKYKSFKNLKFRASWPEDRFDYVFMVDVAEHLDNRKKVFEKIAKSMNANAVFLNIMMNPVWQPVERVYTWMGLKMPEGPHTRVGFKLLKKELEDSGMRITEHDYKLLVPVKIPFITHFANKYLTNIFRRLCFVEYVIATKARA